MRKIYLIGPVDGCHKIGAAADPEFRLSQLALPPAVKLVAVITTDRDHWLEKYLHRAFGHRRVSGTEWFRLDDAELVLLRSIPHVESESDLPSAVIALHEQSTNEGRPKNRRGKVVVAGREVFSLKGFEELTVLLRTIALRNRITVPEALDRCALAGLRRAHAKLPKLGEQS